MDMAGAIAVTEVQMDSKLSKEFLKISWRVSDIDSICPPDCQDFDKINSEEFSGGSAIGKKCTLFLSISGIDGFLCFQIHAKDIENQNGLGENRISGSMTVFAKDVEGKALHSQRLSKFTLRLRPGQSQDGFPQFMPLNDIRKHHPKSFGQNAMSFQVIITLHGELISTRAECTRKIKRRRRGTVGCSNDDEESDEDSEDSYLEENNVENNANHGRKEELISDLEELSPSSVEAEQEMDLDSGNGDMVLEIMNSGKLPKPLTLKVAIDLLHAAEDLKLNNVDMKELIEACKFRDHTNLRHCQILCHKYGGNPIANKFIEAYCNSSKKRHSSDSSDIPMNNDNRLMPQ